MSTLVVELAGLVSYLFVFCLFKMAALKAQDSLQGGNMVGHIHEEGTPNFSLFLKTTVRNPMSFKRKAKVILEFSRRVMINKAIHVLYRESDKECSQK